MGAAVTTLPLLVALAVANDSGTCAADGTCYSCLALSGGSIQVSWPKTMNNYTHGHTIFIQPAVFGYTISDPSFPYFNGQLYGMQLKRLMNCIEFYKLF